MLDSLLRFDRQSHLRATPTLPEALLGRAMATVMTADHPEMQNRYQEYISQVSSPEMAISWKIATLTYAIAAMMRPRSICDTGSGFSSYVLRKYQASAASGVSTVSVDDHEGWLGKTRDYLTSHGVDASNVLHWSEFKQTSTRFDLLFHDVGSMTVRAETLPHILSRMNPGGVLILDDMHKPKYRRAAREILRQHGLSSASLRELCLDEYGRFAEVVILPEAS